jgi:hypothetical protein
MFTYNIKELQASLKSIIRNNVPAEAFQWLENQASAIELQNDISKFNTAFVLMPRKTGKGMVALTKTAEDEITTLRAGFTLAGWTIDRLSRAWLITHLAPGNKEKYISAIENLFLTAEMDEQVALYASLPLLAYPETWRKRCAEGIRSNMGKVLEAIMCNNPYPAEQLDEPAWNQLVLKAIFTEKPVLKIYNLRQRTNQKLAHALSDYAHERWAAQRTVNPLVWYCAGNFVDERTIKDIERLAQSPDIADREAAALVCAESGYLPAKELLVRDSELGALVKVGNLSWQKIENETSIRLNQ